MSTSADTTETSTAKHVRVTDRALVVELRDGRVVSVPLEWYPRLSEGSPKERRRWELLGTGMGIHWPDLDEDISINGLLTGQPSGESQQSFNQGEFVNYVLCADGGSDSHMGDPFQARWNGGDGFAFVLQWSENTTRALGAGGGG